VEVNNLFILSGSPGTGKTTLIAEIEKRGLRTYPEPARRVLAQQRKIGGTALPEIDPKSFIQNLLRLSVENYRDARLMNGVAVFDRGIPDTLAYARWFKTPEREIIAACAQHRYQRRVFFLEPWPEIYANDSERKMTFEQVIDFSESLAKGYRETGYELVPVPALSPPERAEWVMAEIGA